ncbi:Patched domain-containing protein 3 [Aphelenchoides besseyi]|nr:Patched domain-containing protein 3 [Aphelenchoides besseyi]
MRKFGYLIGKHPVKLVIFTFVILIPMASFFLLHPIHVDTDVRRGFAHRNGRSTQEFRAFGRFYGIEMSDLELLVILIESKNGGDSSMIMSAKLLNEVSRLNTFVTSLSVPLAEGGNLTFKELEPSRGTSGNINARFHAFKFGYDWQNDLLTSNSSISDGIQLDFPVSKIFGHNVTIVSHFFGVKRHSEYSANRPSQIKSVNTIALWYMISAPAHYRRSLQQMELKVFDASQTNFSDEFTFYTYGDEIANREMMKGSEQTTKLLVVGLALMITFVGVQLRDFPLRTGIILTAACIGSPLFSILAAFGLMGWLGVQFNSLMSISPFLVLGIGVDDAFLLLHSWRKHFPRSSNSAELSEMVIADVGPSVCITSVTNVLAFSIGIFSPAPQMSGFCLCTTLAVLLDFVFEFTFFAPCLALTTPTTKQMSKPSVRDESEHSGWSKYAHFLLSPYGKLVCFGVIVSLYISSYCGISLMETTFDPQKTFPFDSHLQLSLIPINRLYVEYSPLSFIVNKPPDIRNHTELELFYEMVKELEDLPQTRKNMTHLWLRDYLDYNHQKHLQSNTSSDYTPNYQRTPDFLTAQLLDDKNVVLWHKEESNDTNNREEVVLDSFVFVVVCFGERTWHQRADFVEQIRNLIDKYPQFDVSVFDYDATIYDLIITVKSEMLKAVLVTLACMVIVCFVIIPNVLYTLIAALSVISISYNLLGVLGLWGQMIDPVVMINVVVAVGFSVDFVAHMIYHHWQLEREERILGLKNDAEDMKSKHRRLVISLTAVGRPMIEAALSTAIVILPLFMINIYVVLSFAKTVICVGSMGMIHGLLIVPVILTLPNPWTWLTQKCGRRTPTPSTESGVPLMIPAFVENKPME